MKNELVGFVRGFVGEDEERRCIYMSISEYDSNNEEHNPWDEEEDEELLEELNQEVEPNLVCRVVIESEGIDLVDGVQLYFINTEEGFKPTWESTWEGNQPELYGADVEYSRKWCKNIGELIEL